MKTEHRLFSYFRKYMRVFNKAANIESEKYYEPLEVGAHLQNRILYKEVNSLDPKNREEFTDRLKFYCGQLNYSNDYTKAWLTHVSRLMITKEWLEKLVSETESRPVIVETGGESVVTHLFREFLPKCDWHITKGDLRYEWDLPKNFADIVISFEVVEHLSDPPVGFQDSFEMVGFKNFLKHCYETLKPGGILFLTTPNSASIFHLKNILIGYTPWFFSLHVREYSTHELVSLLTEANFTIDKINTIHCLTSHLEVDYSPVFYTLLQNNFETHDRGDDIFVVARKGW